MTNNSAMDVTRGEFESNKLEVEQIRKELDELQQLTANVKEKGERAGLAIANAQRLIDELKPKIEAALKKKEREARPAPSPVYALFYNFLQELPPTTAACEAAKAELMKVLFQQGV